MNRVSICFSSSRQRAFIQPAAVRFIRSVWLALAGPDFRPSRARPSASSTWQQQAEQQQDVAALDRCDVPGVDTALHLAVRLRLPSMASALAAAGANPT